MNSISPNPWGREYTRDEWFAARHVWDQYRDASERPSPELPNGRGPLIYGRSDQIVVNVWSALADAERRVTDLRLLLLAVERETLAAS